MPTIPQGGFRTRVRSTTPNHSLISNPVPQPNADPRRLVGEALLRLHRERQLLPLPGGAADPGSTIQASGEDRGGIGTGPQLGEVLLRMNAAARQSVPDGSVTDPIGGVAPVSSMPGLGETLIKVAPMIPPPGTAVHNVGDTPKALPLGNNDPTYSKRVREFGDRFNQGARFLLGPHATQGVTNVLEMLTPIIIPRDVGQAVGETGRAAREGDGLVVVGGIGNVGLAVLGIGPGKLLSKFGAPTIRTVRSRPTSEGGVVELQSHKAEIRDVPNSTPKVVETRIHIERQRPGSNTPGVEAVVVFKVDGEMNIPETVTGVKQVREILGTVHNSVAEFVTEEAPKGVPIIVRFRAATPRHEKFYQSMMPELEEVYGVKVVRGTTKGRQEGCP